MSAMLDSLLDAERLADCVRHDDESRAWTGWPPGMLQDDCRKLSRWFAGKPDARRLVREAVRVIVEEQTEETEQGVSDAQAG